MRDLTFCGLGSLAGGTWAKVATATSIIDAALAGAAMLERGLNGLAFEGATALHLGIPVKRVRCAPFLAAATGAEVTVSSGIGFVGIVVPHLLRLSTGSDHGPLLTNCTLPGTPLHVLTASSTGSPRHPI